MDLPGAPSTTGAPEINSITARSTPLQAHRLIYVVQDLTTVGPGRLVLQTNLPCRHLDPNIATRLRVHPPVKGPVPGGENARPEQVVLLKVFEVYTAAQFYRGSWHESIIAEWGRSGVIIAHFRMFSGDFQIQDAGIS